MSRLTYFVRETLISLRRNLMMTMSGIITIAVTATMVSGMLLFIWGNDRAAAKQKGDIELEIFMNVKATAGQVNNVQAKLDTLKHSGELKSYKFYDHAAALAEFKRLFKNQPDIVESVRKADLPESFRVNPRQAKDLEVIASEFEGLSGVDQVNTPARLIRPYFRKVDRARNLVAITAIALTISSVFLIVMTVRLATYARRREIEVMKLVGASNLFVRIPFLAEGALQGFIGGGIAIALTYLAKSVLHDFAGSTASANFLVLRGFELHGSDALRAGLLVLAGGTFIGLVSAAFGVRRFLDV